nr:hypothetical protein [uncultured Treponema sp.]
MKKFLTIWIAVLLLLCTTAAIAEEISDGFGFDDNSESGSAFSVDIGGRLSLGGAFFFNDFKTFRDVQPGSLIEGKLHIHATAPLTEAYFGVRLNSKTLAPLLGTAQAVYPVQPQIAPWIDEAYLKMLFGPAVITGGIQKISWGRAETLSVLDIVNPRDRTDLTLLYDPQALKIARPLVSAAVYLPHDLKLEGVFLPVFEGDRIVTGSTGRWYSHQFDRLWGSPAAFRQPATNTLEYAQGGGRLTAAVGGMHDFGVQYFYGRLPELAFKTETLGSSIPGSMGSGGGSVLAPSSGKTVTGVYNPYHHIGVDYGLGIGPVALSAELAANITSDISGDDPSVYNPSLAWNVGAVYSAPLGFKLNLTAAETVRLQHKRTGLQSHDVEYGRNATDTKLSFSVAQTLLRSSLEWKLGMLIGLEDADFCIMPGIHWQLATLLLDCNVGIFGGSRAGRLGQFYRNGFIRLTAAYEF